MRHPQRSPAGRSQGARRRWPVVAGLAGALLLSAAATPKATAANAPDGPSRRSPLPAYVPLWATATTAGGTAASDLGAAQADAPVAARVYLAGQDPHSLSALATAVSDPNNPRYRHFLTPAQVDRRFGPSHDQETAIRSWLTGAGLHVTAVTAHYVAVAGTAAEADRAFDTTWHSYRVTAGLPQQGNAVATTPQQSPTPTGRVSTPAALRGAVLTVVPVETGIPGYADTGTRTITPPTEAPSTMDTMDSTPDPAPCSQYFGQRPATSRPRVDGHTPAYAVCGYTPHQLRAAYGVPDALTGAGQSIAVVAGWRTPTTPQDLATYARRNSEPLRPGQFDEIFPAGLDATCHTEDSEYSEDFADLEQLHAMAPEAHLTDLGAKCDDDGEALPILDAYTTVADHHLASIVSSAYNARYNEATVSPGLVDAYDQVFEQGAAEGIGFYVDSDDEGDNSSVAPDHRPTVSFPDADPWVTAVGGTSLAIGPGGRYEGETSWGDHQAGLTADGTSWTSLPGPFAFGGGGGTSRVFTQPAYQRGVVPQVFSRPAGCATSMRVLPDISADAGSGTGILSGVTVSLSAGQPATYHEFAFAGTSASVQLIAGMQADAQQGDGGTAIGFANPAIYARYGTPDYHDVTAQSFQAGVPDSTGPAGDLPPGAPTRPYLTTFGLDETLTADPGYDDATGVGTPAAGYFRSYRGA